VAARKFYDECLELARAGGDAKTIANALYNDSFPRMVDKSDVPGSLRLIEEALPIYRELGDQSGIARCLWTIGNLQHQTGQLDLAIIALDEAIGLFRKLDERFSVGWALHTRAVIAIQQGDPATAWAMVQEGLEIFWSAGDVSGIVLLLDDAASLAKLEGQTTRAIRIAGAAHAHQLATGAALASIINVNEGRAWRETITNSDQERAWSEGQAMSIEKAVAYALRKEPALEAGA